MREVVECVSGPCCCGDHHGWDCPLSDPVGDVLRAIPVEPHPNPILEKVRKEMMEKWLRT